MAYDKFSAHIENCFKIKDNYYNMSNKNYAKGECFNEIFKGEHKLKVDTFILELAISII